MLGARNSFGGLAMLVLGKQLATKSKLNEEERKEEHDDPEILVLWRNQTHRQS